MITINFFKLNKFSYTIGIFISEIHTGSVAENTDLQVGDMLISVNQIQLINMDYDLVS